MARLAALLALAFVVALGAAGAHVWNDLHRTRPVPEGSTALTVPAGSNLRGVVRQMRSLGLLRYQRPFLAWARYHGMDRSVQSGTYRLPAAISPIGLLDLLQQGPALEPVRVTIPEGFNAVQIFALLERAGLGGEDVFRGVVEDPNLLLALDLPASGVEGYLFPDTYSFTYETAPEAIVRTLIERFRRISRELEPQRLASGMSEADMVTLASVVEKETGRAEERPLIAGVFHNRLRRGMRLQSDPTVIYGLSAFDGNLTRADLADPSPYNTYAHRGLPPGPIASPGRAALEAAVAPAETEALYFVSRNDGSHQFSRTLTEHNRAVWEYQKRPRASAGR